MKTHLLLKVFSANLAPSNSKGDLYCIFEYKDRKITTKVQNETITPIWNEEFNIGVVDSQDEITFRLYDKKKNSQFLGQAKHICEVDPFHLAKDICLLLYPNEDQQNQVGKLWIKLKHKILPNYSSNITSIGIIGSASIASAVSETEENSEDPQKRKGSRIGRVKSALISRSRESKSTTHTHFKVSLEDILRRENAGVPMSESHYIPTLIKSLIDSIEETSLEVPGIFRIGPTHNDLLAAKTSLDDGTISFKELDHHTKSGLLKAFLRDLPGPLMTYEIYPNILKLASETNISHETKITKIKENLFQIPLENFHLLQAIIRLLYQIHLRVEINLMPGQNLGIVFGPNLLYSPTSIVNPESYLSEAPHIISIVGFIIENYPAIFDDPNTGLPSKVRRYPKKQIKALYSWTARSENELSFQTGDILYVLEQRSDLWWLCFKEQYIAYVPGNFFSDLNPEVVLEVH